MKKTNSTSDWLSPPDNLDLEPHQVDIWRVQISIPDALRARLESTLSEAEGQAAARIHRKADRDRYITAHGCLRDILARYLHCGPGQLNFSKGEYGKPALDPEEGIDFNLTHSSDFALIAVARGRSVGVDVERIRKGISSHVIAQQYFSKAEVAELQELPIEQRVPAFFTCWTRKEAYIKAKGMGLSLPLESFDVSLSPDEPALLRATRPDPLDASRWTLLSLDVDPRYGAALAVETAVPGSQEMAEAAGLEFRKWEWREKGPPSDRPATP